MNSFIRNISITKKLAFLLTLPVLLLVWLLTEQFVSNIQNVRTAQHLTHAINISTELSKLIGSLQAERGATAVFVDSEGKRFSQRLQENRKATDSQVSTFNSLAQNDVNLQTQLTTLTQLRQQVDRFSLNGSAAIAAYNAMIADMITFNYQLEAQIKHLDMARQVAALNQFLELKDRAGRERAILARTFTHDSFTTELLTLYSTNLGAYRAYEDNMRKMLHPALTAAWQQALNSAKFQEVEQIRQKANNTNIAVPFGIDSDNWFDLASQKLAVMSEFEQQLFAQLSADTSNVYQDAMSRLWLMIALMVIAILVLCWLTLAIIRNIAIAVQDIDGTIIRLSQRDLTARTTYRSQDEFGRIANGTNKMASELQQVLTEIGSATVQVASAAEESSVVTLQASKTIQQQKQDTELVATAMHEMTTTVRDVAGSTSEAATLSESVQTSAVDGQKKLKQTIDLIKKLSAQVKDTSVVIGKVKHDSDTISSVLDVIRGIADQTNLLALNAAIEAARAGEHGRGFAVVADEVRTLAMRTTQSTRDIQQMIEGLQQGTSLATDAMQQSFKQAEESNEQITETGQILSVLLGEVSGISDKNIQIASAAEEQSIVADDINQKMLSISDSLVQASAGAEQTAITSRELARLAEELEGLIGRFKLS